MPAGLTRTTTTEPRDMHDLVGAMRAEVLARCPDLPTALAHL